jgi:hypothetical protein
MALHGVCRQKSGGSCEKRGVGGYAVQRPLTEPPADHSGQLASLSRGSVFKEFHGLETERFPFRTCRVHVASSQETW